MPRTGSRVGLKAEARKWRCEMRSRPDYIGEKGEICRTSELEMERA
jgi:hypothetical protein